MARIDDGFSTTISFSAGTSALTVIWEKEITPPGISGGGENDTTTMRNTSYRTKWPKSLKTLTESSLLCAYDPDAVTEYLSMINVNQSIEITFPGSEVLTFWGYVDSFTMNAIVEGEQPTAEVVIIPTNQNNYKVETAPAIS